VTSGAGRKWKGKAISSFMAKTPQPPPTPGGYILPPTINALHSACVRLKTEFAVAVAGHNGNFPTHPKRDVFNGIKECHAKGL
jgi:hypothetical protein